MPFIPEPGLTEALQTPQPAVIAGAEDAVTTDWINKAFSRTSDAFANYHKQVPVNAFNSVYLLNLIGNNWSGWK